MGISTDWLMVIITAIYVVATIVMCVFNYISTHMSKIQIEEMKKQHNEDQMLKIMPCIQVKPIGDIPNPNIEIICDLSISDTESKSDKRICFEVSNIGQGIAKSVKYHWNCGLGESFGVIDSLLVGDRRTICVIFKANENNLIFSHSLVISYQDIQDNFYRQELHLYFTTTNKIIELTNNVLSAPQLITERIRNNTQGQKKETEEIMLERLIMKKYRILPVGISGFTQLFHNTFGEHEDIAKESSAITYLIDCCEKVEYSFEEINNSVALWISSFEKYGITHGDRVAIIAHTTPNTIMAILALALDNITAVLIDSNLPKEVINANLAYSDTRGVFTTKTIFNSLESEIIGQIPVFNIELSDFKPVLFQESANYVKCGSTTDKNYDVIAILFSSGTSSAMKGVMITYDSIILSYQKQKYVFGLKPGEKFLHILPLNHISGYSSLITFLLSGCNVGIVENINAAKLQNSLLKFNPHYFCMVTKVYDQIADKIMGEIRKRNFVVRNSLISLINFCGLVRKRFGFKLGKMLLRTVYSKAFGKNISGLAVMGTLCKPETAKLFLNFGIEWANLYGATETSAPISSTGIYDKYIYDSVGKVNQFNDISIKINAPDENGIGEIYVKTPMIMNGYFRDAETTIKAFENGYFKTGDLGYIDSKNYLHVTGRAKETIVLQNGEKVSASDIDAFYQCVCPEIKVASCGITNDDGTDEIHIFIEKADNSDDVVNRAIDALRKRSFESNLNYRLYDIHIIDKIPETSIGKTKRYLLKEQVKNISPRVANINTSEKLSVEETVINIVIKHAKAVDCEAELQSRLSEDLGLDSLALFEIANEISLQLNVEVAGMLENIKTVGELINAVQIVGRISETLDMTIFPHAKTEKDIRSLGNWICLCHKIYNFKVSGLENIPKNENYILCSNHINNLDPIWILAAMGEINYRKIGCLAAIHLYESKRTRKMFNMIGAIPVDRSGNTSIAMKRCKECLQDGYSLIIFPEGARSRDGNMLPFKNGAAALSSETGTPILPARIDGGFEIFPRHKKLPRIFDFKNMQKLTLKISFGKPIFSNGDDAQTITEDLKREIENLKK